MCSFVLSFHHVNPRIRLSLVASTVPQCAILLAAQKLPPEFQWPAPHVKSWETETGESQGLAHPLPKADELQAQQEMCYQSKVENDRERDLVSTTACMYTDSHTFSPHMHTGQDEAEASHDGCMSAWVLYKRMLCVWS